MNRPEPAAAQHPSVDDDWLHARAVAAVYDLSTAGALLGMGNGVALAWLNLGTMPGVQVGAWLAATIGVAALRLLSVAAYRRGRFSDWRVPYRWAVAISAVSGIVWGAAGILFIALDFGSVPLLRESELSNSARHLVTLVFLIGMPAGAIFSFASAPAVFYPYASLALAPPALVLATQGTAAGGVFAVAVLIYLVFLLLAGRRFGRLFRNSLAGQFHSEQEVARRTRELADALDRLRLIAENLPAFICQLGGDGTVRYLNRTAAAWCAIDAGEAVGRPLALPVLDSGPANAEESILFPDGRQRWVHRVVVPVSGGEGGRLVLAVDISDRKQAELALRQRDEELLHARKLESIGQLTGGVAHDFNNLLGVIVGNLDLIEPALAGGPEHAYLGRAIEAAERAAALTGRLLAFARKQALQPSVVDVAGLISGTVELIGRSLGESIAIEIALADDLWPCRVDRGQLETAIVNLAINARDAMPAGGRLVIRAVNARPAPADAARLDLSPGLECVRIEVSDTGTGMTPEVRERAFEPFFTTKEFGKGSGLGLSMVHGFVKQSGGSLEITTTPGVGTTIALYLPRHEAAAAEPKRAPLQGPEPRGQGETVLVVEDNVALRDIALNALRELGYAPVAAGDARAALDVLRARSDVAVLFTDIVLPGGVDGFALATQARAQSRALKVLYASGSREVMNKVTVPDGPMIRKPYRRAELAAQMARLMAG